MDWRGDVFHHDIFILKCGQSSGGDSRYCRIATQQHYATNIRVLVYLRVISRWYHHHAILCRHERPTIPSMASNFVHIMCACIGIPGRQIAPPELVHIPNIILTTLFSNLPSWLLMYKAIEFDATRRQQQRERWQGEVGLFHRRDGEVRNIGRNSVRLAF